MTVVHQTELPFISVRIFPAGSGCQALIRAQSALVFPCRVQYGELNFTSPSFCYSPTLTTETPYSHPEQEHSPYTDFILSRPGIPLPLLGSVLALCPPLSYT